MKKIYTLILSLCTLCTYAQEFSWARQAGLYAYDYGYGVGTDAAGNVYVAGKYEEDANFDGTIVTCQGNHDMFVAKYSPTGSLLWIRTGGGTSGDYAHSLAVDATGNVYVCGEIEGVSTFGSVTVNGNPGTDDAFVAKYNTNGDLQWVKSYGGYDRDDARGIAIDASGNSYVIGVFRNQGMFGTFTLNAAGGNIDDVFVMKLDPSGTVVWVKQIGSPGDDTGRGIAVDGTGNVYATGGFIGTATFGSVSLTSTGPNASSFRDTYLAKYDNSGTLLWVKQGGDNWDDVSWAVAVDPTGNAYITGEFNGNAVFGSTSVSTLTSAGADVFVVKYDPSGNVSWAKRFGGEILDRGRGIAVDASNVFITGQFSGTATHGSYAKTAADSSDIFIASFSTSGAEGWLVRPFGAADAPESLGYEGGNAVAVDATGKVLVTGSFLDGDNFNFYNLDGWSRTDMFVAKIDPGVAQGTDGIANMNVNNQLNAYPNPTNGFLNMSFKADKNEIYTFSVVNSLGQIVFTEIIKDYSGDYKKSIDLSLYGKGLYLVTVSSAEEKLVNKISVD